MLPGQIDMFDSPAKPYPQGPGFKERTTSKLAAAKIESRAATLREQALQIIKTCPSTADEVADRIGASILAVRPRLSELREMGLIRPQIAGAKQVRRENVSGVSAIAWEAT